MFRNKAQIAIEFLLLTTISLFFLFTILIVLNRISSDNARIQSENALDDLGISLRDEIKLASEMENGYHRSLDLPRKIRGKSYSLTLETGVSGISYLVVSSENYEAYYSIPETTGTISVGRILITKKDNILITSIS